MRHSTLRAASDLASFKIPSALQSWRAGDRLETARSATIAILMAIMTACAAYGTPVRLIYAFAASGPSGT